MPEWFRVIAYALALFLGVSALDAHGASMIAMLVVAILIGFVIGMTTHARLRMLLTVICWLVIAAGVGIAGLQGTTLLVIGLILTACLFFAEVFSPKDTPSRA